MRNMKSRFVGMLLLVSCLMTMVVNAEGIVPYASDQLHAYDADAIACGGGKLAIEFSVEGTGVMKSIGASKITIYEKYGTDGWMIVGAFTEKDNGMKASDKNSYGNTKYFDGVSGTQYKVSVTIFATDYDNVTDSRTITTYVTA